MPNWLAKIQELNLELVVSKTIRGCDISLLLADHPKINFLDIKEDFESLFSVFFIEYIDMEYNVSTLSWHIDII